MPLVTQDPKFIYKFNLDQSLDLLLSKECFPVKYIFQVLLMLRKSYHKQEGKDGDYAFGSMSFKPAVRRLDIFKIEGSCQTVEKPASERLMENVQMQGFRNPEE